MLAVSDALKAVWYQLPLGANELWSLEPVRPLA
jgi:hypothetical protein